MQNKQHLDVWQIAARVARMDAEIGALWDIVQRVTGEKPRVHDERQEELFNDGPLLLRTLRGARKARANQTPPSPNRDQE